MENTSSIPVIRYDADRIPDDRPGAGQISRSQFLAVYADVISACERHGPVDEDSQRDFYFVDAEQYNDERYQYVEVCKPEAVTLPWLLDLMATLKRHSHWGIGIPVRSTGPDTNGYMLVFEDRIMVSGPHFQQARSVEDVVMATRAAMHLKQNK